VFLYYIFFTGDLTVDFLSNYIFFELLA